MLRCDIDLLLSGRYSSADVMRYKDSHDHIIQGVLPACFMRLFTC